MVVEEDQARTGTYDDSAPEKNVNKKHEAVGCHA
jgi:hypothetical protein